MTTFYTFFCARYHRKTLTVVAKGYWKTIKEWICDEVRKRLIKDDGI